MEANINFLLWRWNIIVEENKDWIINYLQMFNAYVQPGVIFDNLNALFFNTLNSKKTSKAKANYELPPNVTKDDFNGIPEVIMASWKI